MMKTLKTQEQTPRWSHPKLKMMKMLETQEQTPRWSHPKLKLRGIRFETFFVLNSVDIIRFNSMHRKYIEVQKLDSSGFISRLYCLFLENKLNTIMMKLG
jgi:hypothetical protein